MSSLLSLQAFRIAVTSLPVAASLCMTSAGVYAQDSGLEVSSNLAVSVIPYVSVTETLTDNVRLTSVGKQAEQITEVSPGIRVVVNGARLKSYFDYSLTGIVYAQNSSPRRTQNALNTFGTLEAIDNWAYLDFSGFISQQAISAFGNQSINNSSINQNQAEVSTFRLSPYVRGRLGDLANYDARYTRAITRSDAVAGSGVTSNEVVGRIGGDSTFRNLGWLADASYQIVDYSAGRSTKASRSSIGLSYAIMSQLSVFANAGIEANNYTTFNSQSYRTSGFGLRWSLSERTNLSASRDNLSFGEGYSLNFEHRTARTAWRFSSTKGVSTTPSQTSIASLGPIYDILYTQFASIEPNPVLRAQLVNAFLQANGVSPNATVINSFLTSAVSLQRQQNLMFALLGVRDTITFIATQTETSRLDTLSRGIDDFNTSSLVRQRGFSVNYARRLTPDNSLGVLASQQNTSGSSSLQNTKLRLLNVNITGRIGRKTFASIGARRTMVSSSSTLSYKENAVYANLTAQF